MLVLTPNQSRIIYDSQFLNSCHKIAAESRNEFSYIRGTDAGGGGGFTEPKSLRGLISGSKD